MNEEKPVVKQEEEVTTLPATPEVAPVAAPGDKTPSALLLESLQAEREKRRLLEEELSVLRQNASGNDDEVFSDEGKTLLKKISTLEEQLAATSRKESLERLQGTHPALKDKAAEFQEFLSNPENAGMRLETAAKAFLLENDLIETTPPRKGLESQRGSQKAPPQEGMSPEDIKNLRVNNYRKYSKLVREGKIKF